MTTQMNITRWARTLSLALAIGCAGLVAPRATAQDGGAEREVAAAKERIKELVNYAEELKAVGRLDAAAHALAEAEELKARLNRHVAERKRGGERDRGAQRERERGPEGERAYLMDILEHLEHGMVALRELERYEELEVLERVANDVRREIHGGEGEREREDEREHEGRGHTEREIAHHQLDVMRLAMPALLEAGREDAAELLEHAIHARELALEGRRDEEANRIRETAPSLGQQVEILGYAARLWEEFGHEEKARALAELTEQFRAHLNRGREREGARERERGREREGARERERGRHPEREMLSHEVEVMKMAMPALREGERRDAVDLLERAIQARVVMLEGMEGREAESVLEHQPGPGDLAEILGMATELWQHFGNHDKAEIVAELAGHFREQAQRGRDEREHERAQERGHAQERERPHQAARIEEIERAIDELSGALEELHEELAELRERRGR